MASHGRAAPYGVASAKGEVAGAPRGHQEEGGDAVEDRAAGPAVAKAAEMALPPRLGWTDAGALGGAAHVDAREAPADLHPVAERSVRLHPWIVGECGTIASPHCRPWFSGKAQKAVEGWRGMGLQDLFTGK